MMTDETANYRWSVESPGNHAKRAEKTLDAALEATKPPKKWYGGTPPRSDNAFKQYEHQLGKALKGMTNDDVRTLADAASKRAETLDGTGPRGAADRRLMKEIETMAVATQSHRKNRTMTDLDSLTSSRDPAVMRRTVQDMEPDRLRLLNQRANGVGSGPVDAATRRACTTVNNVASSRFGRTCGYSGKGPDRIPSPAQKEELLTTDMTHTYKKSDYLIEATPLHRECM